MTKIKVLDYRTILIVCSNCRAAVPLKADNLIEDIGKVKAGNYFDIFCRSCNSVILTIDTLSKLDKDGKFILEEDK